MKITVITPSLNEAESIQYCLDSVVCQSHCDIEHIIVDGGSTDGTLETIYRYAATANFDVKVIENCNKGIYGALNEGIKIATGSVIATLHANDYYTTPNELESVAAAFEQNNCDIVYGDIHYTQKHKHTGCSRYYSARRFSRKLLLDGFMPPHPAVFIKRKIFTRHGLYTTRYRVAGDFDLLVRLILVENLPTLYMARDMVAMSPGGLSSHIVNRLYRTNSEKFDALRRNGIKISRLRLLKRYFYL